MYLDLREKVELRILQKRAEMRTQSETALRMLRDGLDIAVAAAYTGLPEDEVRCLAKKA